MIEKLDEMGYTNQVYVPTYDKNIGVITPNANVIVSECFKKWDRLFFDYKQRKILKDIESKIKVDQFDCIHAYTLFTDGNCARKLSKKYNVPYVVAVRNTDVNAFFAKMIHLRKRGIKIMRDAKAIFFLSEAYRKQVFDKYVPEKFKEELLAKTRIIPNGIDDFWFENEMNESKVLTSNKSARIVFAGRIDKNKNVPTTQKAISILRDKGYELSLTVVGKVEDKEEYKRILNDSSTVVLDPMGKEKLIDVYRNADIFVMPSFTESFGLVYVEAMTQGLPVVYSKGQGFDGQFQEGEAGYSASAYSPDSVAEAIEKVINEHEAISPRVAHLAKRFNWTEIAKDYDLIYNKIIG